MDPDHHHKRILGIVGNHIELYHKSSEFHEFIDIYVYATELLIDRMAKACDITERDKADKIRYLIEQGPKPGERATP